jgi:uncharacterized membrane protein YozB (DUF420 family)
VTWHHVAALLIATWMVVAVVYLVVHSPSPSEGREMFFGVVQLANTICSGVAGMALGPMLLRHRAKHKNGSSIEPMGNGK